jgi:phosphatidylinositol glycan class A protein
MRVLIVSDFFFPRLGGVELHQYSLAQGLIKQGHRVCVLTGTYAGRGGRRQGVRHMSNGLKVYYVPYMSIHSQASMPYLFTLLPLFRQIVVREGIQVVHGHQTTSSLSHECLLHAKSMGLATVYTDHSLFGFGDAPAIHLNKLMSFTLTQINHVICVSHCMRENLCLRARLDPKLTSVIPNALDAGQFKPAAAWCVCACDVFLFFTM